MKRKNPKGGDRNAVSLEDKHNCVAQAFAEFQQRWGRSKGTPTLVAHMASILFSSKLAALKGGSDRPSIHRLRELIEEMSKTRSPSENSFKGNKSVQSDLAAKLEKLDPYLLPDGSVLRVVGPQHTVNGEAHFYLDIVHTPKGSTRDLPSPVPVDEHGVLARRFALRVAKFIEKTLLRRSPHEVRKLERTAKRRGIRYALIGLFFPLACASVYYYVTHRIYPYAVTIAPVDLNKGKRIQHQTDLQTVTIIRWRSDSIYGPFTVYKNGQYLAKTDKTVYVDRQPIRDHTPNVERIVDIYRIEGWLAHLLPRISIRVPPDDRVQPNVPCRVNGTVDLCTPLFNIEELSSEPFDAFRRPIERLAVVGRPHWINITAHFAESSGANIAITSDLESKTAVPSDATLRKEGDTISIRHVFRTAGFDVIRLKDERTGGLVASIPFIVLSEDQLRNRALRLEKFASYDRPDVLRVMRWDVPVTLIGGVPSAPQRGSDGTITRPQVFCARPDGGSDIVFISIYPTFCDQNCEIEVDYDYEWQMTPTEITVTADGYGQYRGIATFVYSRAEDVKPPESETLSAWVYERTSRGGERRLSEVIRKHLIIPNRHLMIGEIPLTITRVK